MNDQVFNLKVWITDELEMGHTCSIIDHTRKSDSIFNAKFLKSGEADLQIDWNNLIL